ncbi:methyltransferase domain-containing protein [Steroidobacter sp. S1-65]|uniref:Methyltransferase domain-containing protein n=1 Tax=Steroidobacter gossypii TaxID=2805490 RepID=A0ABS1WXC9_9GAMM|nr:methyltransferase domain-containing protein [Steroidobacter gossypii]MBM0105626.1 methyltransferase domain-containing protein [Steroidobacter gossypii]
MNALQSLLPPRFRPAAKRAFFAGQRIVNLPLTVLHKAVLTPAHLISRRSRPHRKLEIGPGAQRIDGFETLNVVPASNVDYVWDAAKRLPFADGAFEVVYASHILEHIPWYNTEAVLAEWARIVSPGGRLEIWVPDGLKICKAFVDAEERRSRDYEQDGWFRFNEQKDPCRWASGRIFSYGDGVGTLGHPNWHLAVFSFRYLEQALKRAGCRSVERLQRSQVRGHDHGWINLGIAGVK